MILRQNSAKAASWGENQKEFYREYPHAHLKFNPASTYAQNIVGQVLKYADLGPDKKFLEVGCGSGRFTLHLVRRGIKVTAMDLSLEMLDRLSAAAEQLTICNGLDLRSGDVSEVARFFGVGEFDNIVGFFFLHHLENIRSALEALDRVLKRGGSMIFVEPNRLNPFFLAQILLCPDMTWRAEKGTFRYGVAGYRRCFEEAGFNVVTIRKFGFFPPQILDRLPISLGLEKWLERLPLVKAFLPFLLVEARKIA